MLRVEPAGIADLSGAYRTCLLTGDAGRDATALHDDPDLLGHVYVGPYLAQRSGTQLVVIDEGGVCGYLLSTDDTLAFQRWAEVAWWPPLRARYPLDRMTPRDTWLVEQIHAPRPTDPDLATVFPAHLHMDLLERTRSLGLGRVLMERLLWELRGRGVTGVHLGADPANTNAIGFYRHLGFVELHLLPDELVMGLDLGG